MAATPIAAGGRVLTLGDIATVERRFVDPPSFKVHFDGKPALQDGRLRERWADLYLKEQALWLLQCRALTALAKGREPGPETSGAKIVVAQARNVISRRGSDANGPLPARARIAPAVRPPRPAPMITAS